MPRRDSIERLSISFQYCEQCPSYEQALERLRKVLVEENVQATLEIIKVQSDEQARQLQFIGSPTIQINGKDIDTPSSSIYRADACRIYTLDDGRVSPLPSENMIRKTVRSCRESLKRVPS